MATLYFILEIPGSDTDITYLNVKSHDYVDIDTTIKALKEFDEDVIINTGIVEQWEIEKWIEQIEKSNNEIRFIITTTPLDICIERNNKEEEPVSNEVMQKKYNNYIMTTGWLYMNHSEKIFNSEN